MRPSRILAGALVFLATSPIVALAQDDHGAEGGGGGLFDINVGLSAWTLVVFAGLVFILGRYAWGPILAAVQAREEGIQGKLDEAAKRNQEAADLLEQHRVQLAEARREAADILAQGKAAGEKLRKEAEDRARQEGDAIIERARAEIEREKDAALAELRRESVELALAAAGKLMQTKLDPERDRQIVVDYLDDLAKRGGRGASA
jgi:F-type H+-transporting ATPase subunit b